MRTELRGREAERVRVGAHVARQRVFPSPRAEARARRRVDPGRRHRPVFVDDSGRRRRAAGIIGTTAGVVALVYVVFVGSTFAGAPGLGGIDPAGLGSLTNPAGEQADVGRDPVEQAVPAAVAEATDPTGDPVTAAEGPGQDAPLGPAATAAPTTVAAPPATTTTAPATTTTTRHGQGPTTSVPGPNSTVPDKGGPPTSRPGGQ